MLALRRTGRFKGGMFLSALTVESAEHARGLDAAMAGEAGELGHGLAFVATTRQLTRIDAVA